MLFTPCKCLASVMHFHSVRGTFDRTYRDPHAGGPRPRSVTTISVLIAVQILLGLDHIVAREFSYTGAPPIAPTKNLRFFIMRAATAFIHGCAHASCDILVSVNHRMPQDATGCHRWTAGTIHPVFPGSPPHDLSIA